jgi:hypothetical protein
MKNITFVALSALVVIFAVAPVRGQLSANWIRQFGTTSVDSALAVAADSSGTYVVGRTLGTLPGQISAERYDAFLRKYSVAGSVVWTRQFGTWGDDFASGVAVHSSGVYVAGQFSNTTFLRKYDLDGNELWTREIGWAYGDALITTGGKLVVAADATGVYVAGFEDGTQPGQVSAGRTDAFARKFDHDGHEVWTRQFGTAGDDAATGISVSSAGVYISGLTEGALETSFGASDAFIRKYDLDGNEIWTRQFGTNNIDFAEGLAAGESGVYVTGKSGPGFLRKYDAHGSLVWSRDIFIFPFNPTGKAVALDSSGVYVAVEGFDGQLPDGSPDRDVFLRKYDLDGNHLGTTPIETPYMDRASGVAVDPGGGNLYVVGETDGTLSGQTALGASDAFLLRFITRFSLAVTPATVTAPPGRTVSAALRATPVFFNFVNEIWSVSASGLPAGGELLFCNEAGVCTPTATITSQTEVGMKISTCAIPPCSFTTPAGDYPITITGMNGSEIVTTSFTLTVLTPRQHLAFLAERTRAVTYPSVSLTAKLEAALNQLDAGNTEVAIKQLQAFISEVNAQRDFKVQDTYADELVAIAQRIINSL